MLRCATEAHKCLRLTRPRRPWWRADCLNGVDVGYGRLASKRNRIDSGCTVAGAVEGRSADDGTESEVPFVELETVLPDESPSMPVDVLDELAHAAEDLGYATAWLPDHVLPPGEFGGKFGGVYEALVTIAHLAALTERLCLGTSVLVAPLRNPFVLAKQVATLHRLSSGRVILRLGVGWTKEEFDALGVDYSRRGAITDDVLALLSHLFGGGSAPYRSRRLSYEQGVFAPIPDGRVPIMVGGKQRCCVAPCRSLRRCLARHPLEPDRLLQAGADAA